MKYCVKNKSGTNDLKSGNIQVSKQSKPIPYIQRLEILFDSKVLQLFRYEQLLIESRPPAITQYGRAEFDIESHCCDINLDSELFKVSIASGAVQNLEIKMPNAETFSSVKVTWLADQIAPIFEFDTI